MKKFIYTALTMSVLLTSTLSLADESCPPQGGKCLNKEQFEGVKKALSELDQIHKSPVVISTQDKIIIIHDYEGHIYVNGGKNQPLKFKVKIGDTVDRDVAMELPVVINYRDKPPDPMFRLRIRAQLGLLAPDILTLKNEEKRPFWDGGISFDFFHIGIFNLAVYTGIRSVGIGPGIDITKNFGAYIGYSIVYDGWRSNAYAGAYFSFN